MLNVILSLVQMYLEKDKKSSADQIREEIMKITDKGKSIAIASILWLLAALFIFSGLVLFVIEIGLQIDKGIYFVFSGLVVSSLILAFISLTCVLVSLFVLKETPVKKPEPDPVPADPMDQLKHLAYDMALMFLVEFKNNYEKSRSKE